MGAGAELENGGSWGKAGVRRTEEKEKQREMGGYTKELLRKQGRAMASCRAALCLCQDLTLKTELEAVNGKKMLALEVFAHALRFFKEHALQVCCSSQPTDGGRDTLSLLFPPGPLIPP